MTYLHKRKSGQKVPSPFPSFCNTRPPEKTRNAELARCRSYAHGKGEWILWESGSLVIASVTIPISAPIFTPLYAHYRSSVLTIGTQAAGKNSLGHGFMVTQLFSTVHDVSMCWLCHSRKSSMQCIFLMLWVSLTSESTIVRARGLTGLHITCLLMIYWYRVFKNLIHFWLGHSPAQEQKYFRDCNNHSNNYQ